MGVGRVGGGGKRGGAGAAKGGGSCGQGRGRQLRRQGSASLNLLVSASGLVGGGEIAGQRRCAASDPVTAGALDVARMLKSGQIKTKEEATRKLVGDILREKVNLKPKALASKIADQLAGRPATQPGAQSACGSGLRTGNRTRAWEPSTRGSDREPNAGTRRKYGTVRAEPCVSGAQAVQRHARDGRARLVRPGRPARGRRAV